MKWTKTFTCLLLAASIAGSGLGLLCGPDALADEGTDAVETPAVDSEPAATQEPAPEPEPEEPAQSETPAPSETPPADPPSDDNDDTSDNPPDSNTEDSGTENTGDNTEQGGESPTETESVMLNETETGVTMTVGGSYTLIPTFSPTDMELTWESSNPEIVGVQKAADSQNAILTAYAAGSAEITVTTPGGETASCTVTVEEPPKDITVKLNKTDINLLAGNTYTLKPTVDPEEEAENLIWSSSDEKVASVNGNGRVSAHKMGTAVITAKIPDGGEASCRVNVTELGSIKLNYSTYSLRPGGIAKLKADYSPESYSVTWASSDKTVATVTPGKKGTCMVTAVAPGTATIIAALESGETASCQITVRQSSYPSGLPSGLFGSSLFGTTSPYTMPDNIPKNVALTFDCTLGTHTDTILDALYLYDSFATFFVQSKDIYRKDDRVRRIVGEGHAIGIMLTADELTSADTALAALTSANSKLSTVCGVPTRLVTVEGGSADNISQEVYDTLRENGYRVWDWDYRVDETESTAKAAEALEKQLDTTKRVVVRMNTRRRSIQTLETVLGYMRFANMPTRALADSDKPVCQFVKTAN